MKNHSAEDDHDTETAAKPSEGNGTVNILND